MWPTRSSSVQDLPLFLFRNFPQIFLYNQQSRSFRLLQHPPELYLGNLKMEAESYSEMVKQSLTYKTVWKPEKDHYLNKNHRDGVKTCDIIANPQLTAKCSSCGIIANL
jgi:hypothetical protein